MTTRALCLALLLVSTPTIAAAAWPTSPAANGVRLATIQPNDFQDAAVAISDSAGGTICGFRDVLELSLDSYPYLQRLDRSGNVLWGTSGVLINQSSGTYLDDHYHQVVPFGGGGVLIAFAQGQLGYPLVGTHLDATGYGATEFPPTYAIGGSGYRNLLATPGEQGSTWLAWYQLTSARGVYAQRVNASGVPDFGNAGVGVVTGTISDLDGLSDGSGGLIAVVTRGDTVLAQHIDASGNPLWGAGGVVVSNPGSGSSRDVQIRRSSTGNYLVAWCFAASGGGYDVYAQSLDSNGNALWAAGGKPVCSVPGDQRLNGYQTARSQLVADDAGGAYLAWVDYRAGANQEAVYGQHLSSAGVPFWAPNGSPISAGRTAQATVLATDGAGGALAFWPDYRDSGGPVSGVYAQHLTSGSPSAWGAGGVAIANQGGVGMPSAVVPGENGGAVVFWTGDGIRAQRVDGYGHLGEVDPVITSAQDVPGDQGGFVKLGWSAINLDAAFSNPIGSYLLWREVPQSAALRRIAAGAKLAAAGSALGTGDGALWTTTLAGATHYWENVGSVAATGAASYQATVATTADSIPGSNPPTAFMVSALSAAVPGQHWNSSAVSAYSVDNLAPAKPAAFTGQYAAGTAHLHWARNTEPDLAGYRLYRGSDTAFTPGPANLIASPPDTGYTDVAGGSFVYKLTAIDVHGNESAANVLAPGGVTGVGEGLAGALAFAAPAPNPARASGALALRFTLPRAMRAGVSLIAANGRRVVALAPRAFDAGDQSVALPLVDARGARLGAGVYVVRLETEAGAIARRIVVLP